MIQPLANQKNIASYSRSGHGIYPPPIDQPSRITAHKFSRSNYVAVYENRTQLTSKLSQADMGGGKN